MLPIDQVVILVQEEVRGLGFDHIKGEILEFFVVVRFQDIKLIETQGPW
jgi:hypothetical protein